MTLKFFHQVIDFIETIVLIERFNVTLNYSGHE